MPRNNPSSPALPSSLYRVTMLFLTDGNVQEVTFDYLVNEPIPVISDGPNMAYLLNYHAVTNIGVWQSVITGDTAITEVTVADLVPGRTPTKIGFLVPTVGTVTGHSLPLEMQATLLKQSTLKGQHGRGRCMMPAIPISFCNPAVDPNTLTGAAITAYNVVGSLISTTLVAPLGLGFMQPCITTRPVEPAIVPAKAQPTNQAIARPLLGTQRRRRPGRGI
jgi:hypothetical protein